MKKHLALPGLAVPSLALPALALLLSGCIVAQRPPPPYGYGYGYAPYPPPGYAPPPPPGYAPPGDVYGGYYYNGGAPYMVVDGIFAPLIFFEGSWGYYDRAHHFLRAPDAVWRDLEARNPHGAGVRVFDGHSFEQRGGPAGSPQAGRPAYGEPPRTAAPAPGAPPGQAYRPEYRPPAQAGTPREEPRGDRHCQPGQTNC